ncbi:hypothetical protein PDE_09287 [Penicillium oxalicum 114-2]|uniref:Major facilitator superfamily (MFS) profile domain-containing protein n=1 Tax=Penicillium oxalicum (strain 114-2 / CGMCC 5302) TaxID=933388 RepID=S8B643_PENO1|nr:hypothetical protein PDE_09287 [Penicillium oxalicum 114-2]
MNFLERALPFPFTKRPDARLPLDEKPCLDEDGYVCFAPDDVENPQNWSKRRRGGMTFVAVVLAINATFASSSPSGCLSSMSSHFGVSQEAAGLTITLFLLGYCAGPLIFAPLSELYGRRWILYGSFTGYIAFNFLCAWPPNFGALLVGRYLSATFISTLLSNTPGMFADIWNPLQRTNAMACFATTIWIGPALGPVTAGFLELKKDWRWSFYVLLWLGGASFLAMLTIPETYAPVILTHRARRIRSQKLAGFENVRAPAEDDERTLHDTLKVALTRPWIILFDPISLLVAVYMSFVYILLYMMFSIYPIVFQQKRGWNAGVGELPLLGTVVGAVLGGVIVFIDTFLQQRKIARGQVRLDDSTPEDRLPLAMVGGIGFAVSMFWFAWTAEFNSIHWVVPTLAGGVLSTFVCLVFFAHLNYLVDVYQMYAASAIAANTIARAASGAAAPLFTRQMFTALGVGGGGSLVAGIATLLAIIPFLFRRYGKQIRVRSRFAPTPDEDREKRGQDEEQCSD